MKHYGFFATKTGEIFLAGADTSFAARAIAEEIFPNEKIEYLGEYSEFEAEISGLDEY